MRLHLRQPLGVLLLFRAWRPGAALRMHEYQCAAVLYDGVRLRLEADRARPPALLAHRPYHPRRREVEGRIAQGVVLGVTGRQPLGPLEVGGSRDREAQGLDYDTQVAHVRPSVSAHAGHIHPLQRRLPSAGTLAPGEPASTFGVDGLAGAAGRGTRRVAGQVAGSRARVRPAGRLGAASRLPEPRLPRPRQAGQAAADSPARPAPHPCHPGAAGRHPPKIVSERLGHATISITLDTYSHAIPAMQEEAAALIAGLVFSGE